MTRSPALMSLHFAADRLDLAGTFQPDPGPDAADAAVLMAQRNQEIGAIEARCPDLDQNLVRLRCGLRQIADFDLFFPNNGGSHGSLPGAASSMPAQDIGRMRASSIGLQP